MRGVENLNKASHPLHLRSSFTKIFSAKRGGREWRLYDYDDLSLEEDSVRVYHGIVRI